MLESSHLPGKLANCRSATRAESKIYIVEGDSAGGSAAAAQQEVSRQSCRSGGKILNVEKATQHKMIKNAEIKHPDVRHRLGDRRAGA